LSKLADTRIPNVAWPAGAVIGGIWLIVLGAWTWAVIHPMMAVGPGAAGQLLIMAGALDRWYPRADARLVVGVKSLAWLGFWAGAGLWAIVVIALLGGVG